MPRLKLSDLVVKRVTGKPPATGRIDYFDTLQTSFGIRVAWTGTSSWFCFYRVDKVQVRDVFGRYPAISLADARQTAKDKLALVQRGRDPRTEEARQKAAETRQRAETFGKVAEQFKLGHLDKKRSGALTWASLKADLLPAWKDLPIRELTRGLVMARLDEIERERGPVARNRRMALVRKLLNWSLDRELVTSNVAARIPLIEEAPRDRTLTDKEIVEVWRASDRLPDPQSQAVKLLILTMQRRNEVFRMERCEIDRQAKEWTIDARRMKGKKRHMVPLTDAMLAVLDTLPQFDPPRDHVFASVHRKRSVPFGDHGQLKAKLDEFILDARRKVEDSAEPPIAWTLHDLRRTGRTGLSRLRIPSHVAERVLAHLPAGIEKTYNVHDMALEKREALDAWSSYVMALVNPAPKVTTIEQARQQRAKKG